MILGFRDVKVVDVKTFLGSLRGRQSCWSFQIFDADYVAGKQHLLFAALNALKAFNEGENISDNIEMESLLYAAGQRQIKRAIEMLGLRPTTSRLAMLVFLSGAEAKSVEDEISKAIIAERDDRVLEVDEEKIKRLTKTFRIEATELEATARDKKQLADALSKAIIERSALLTTQS
jgi:KEOPS complex subunit Cgi121